MIRETNRAKDFLAIFQLYQEVASNPGGLARLKGEITQDYIQNFLAKAQETGLSLIFENDHGILGEIHAHIPRQFCFSHVLTDVTIAVSPRFQSQGIGRKLFQEFLSIVQRDLNQVTRIELISRESNTRALEFYRSLGFQEEGRFRGRIKNLDGSLEADIPMAWHRTQ